MTKLWPTKLPDKVVCVSKNEKCCTKTAFIYVDKCRVCATFLSFRRLLGKKDSYVFADDWDMPDGLKCPFGCWFCIEHFFSNPKHIHCIFLHCYHLHLIGGHQCWVVFTAPRPTPRKCTPLNLPLATYRRGECKLDVNDKDCLCVESTQMWFCLCFRIILYICIIINRHILNIRYLRLIYCVCEKNRLSICL